MKQKESLQTIAYWLCGLCVFGLLMGFLYPPRERVITDSDVRILMLGDSIVGECRDEQSIPSKVSEALGKKAVNGALGGTRISRLDQSRRPDNQEDGLSVVAITKAIISGDFGVQEMIHINRGATYYFDEAIDTLAGIDYDKVEIVFLTGGINDYHNGIPLEDPKNPMNEYTFGGALRSSILGLKKAYPKLRVIVVTPTYSWYEDGSTCEEKDNGGGVLEDYVRVQLRVAEECGVESIDLYHDFYPHESFEDGERYTRDGVHPNEEGRKKIAERIVEYMTTEE